MKNKLREILANERKPWLIPRIILHVIFVVLLILLVFSIIQLASLNEKLSLQTNKDLEQDIIVFGDIYNGSRFSKVYSLPVSRSSENSIPKNGYLYLLVSGDIGKAHNVSAYLLSTYNEKVIDVLDEHEYNSGNYVPPVAFGNIFLTKDGKVAMINSIMGISCPKGYTLDVYTIDTSSLHISIESSKEFLLDEASCPEYPAELSIFVEDNKSTNIVDLDFLLYGIQKNKILQ